MKSAENRFTIVLPWRVKRSVMFNDTDLERIPNIHLADKTRHKTSCSIAGWGLNYKITARLSIGNPRREAYIKLITNNLPISTDSSNKTWENEENKYNWIAHDTKWCKRTLRDPILWKFENVNWPMVSVSASSKQSYFFMMMCWKDEGNIHG